MFSTAFFPPYPPPLLLTGLYFGRHVDEDSEEAKLPLHGPNQWPSEVMRGWSPPHRRCPCTVLLTTEAATALNNNRGWGRTGDSPQGDQRQPPNPPPSSSLTQTLHRCQELVPGYQAATEAYQAAMEALGFRLLRLLGLSLGLGPDYFAPYFTRPMVFLRPLHYSAEVSSEEGGVYAAGAHTDYGGWLGWLCCLRMPACCCWGSCVSIAVPALQAVCPIPAGLCAAHLPPPTHQMHAGMLTLLKTDGVPGLQINTDGCTWRDVPPIDGCFHVNLGDMLSR